MDQALFRRLMTAMVGVPAVLAAVFLLPNDSAFVIFLGIFLGAGFEFVRLARHFAPSAPLGSLYYLIPGASASLFLVLRQSPATDQLGLWLLAAGALLATIASCTILFTHTEVREGLVAIGIITFAIPLFALPPVGLYQLKRVDPWLVLLLLAIVWLGDTAAFFIGSWIGRHRLAPVVSPNKTWEGAGASLGISLLAVTIWSFQRLGILNPWLVVVAACTSVSAQLGDLLESLIKRGAGIKDSSNILPGHGGLLDRVDAMLLATPLFVLGCWLLGFDSLIP